MSLDEKFAKLVHLIYEAPQSADMWRVITRELVEVTGSSSACLSIVDTQRERYAAASLFGADDSSYAEGLAQYDEGMAVADPTFHYAVANDRAALIDSEAVIGREDYLKHEFVRWTQRYFRTTHWRIRCAKMRDGLSLAISLHTPQDQGRMTDSAAALFDRLFPHVARSAQLAASSPSLADSRSTLIAVDLGGRVIEASDRASKLLAAADGLKLEGHQLVADNPGSQRALDKALAAALTADFAEAETGAARLARKSGKDDLLVVIEPLPRRDRFIDWLNAAAMVRVIDPVEKLGINDTHARLFEFTPRERDIADLLLRGHGPEAAAASLGISYQTARIHLRSLFRKTNTSRQAQLLERLMRVA